MIKTEKCEFITMRIALKTMSSFATNSKMHIPLHVVGAGKCGFIDESEDDFWHEWFAVISNWYISFHNG